jgi:hypothetical protein
MSQTFCFIQAVLVQVKSKQACLSQIGWALFSARQSTAISGASLRVSVFLGGRMEDLGRSERVDRSLADGELISTRGRRAWTRGQRNAERGLQNRRHHHCSLRDIEKPDLPHVYYNYAALTPGGRGKFAGLG